MSIDNAAAHATYALLPQPDEGERDLAVLRSHIGELVNEIATADPARKLEVPQSGDPGVLHDQIGWLNEDLAAAYLKMAGVPPEVHTSECAINQAPAYRPGPCNCGATKR